MKALDSAWQEPIRDYSWDKATSRIVDTLGPVMASLGDDGQRAVVESTLQHLHYATEESELEAIGRLDDVSERLVEMLDILAPRIGTPATRALAEIHEVRHDIRKRVIEPALRNIDDVLRDIRDNSRDRAPRTGPPQKKSEDGNHPVGAGEPWSDAASQIQAALVPVAKCLHRSGEKELLAAAVRRIRDAAPGLEGLQRFDDGAVRLMGVLDAIEVRLGPMAATTRSQIDLIRRRARNRAIRSFDESMPLQHDSEDHP